MKGLTFIFLLTLSLGLTGQNYHELKVDLLSLMGRNFNLNYEWSNLRHGFEFGAGLGSYGHSIFASYKSCGGH